MRRPKVLICLVLGLTLGQTVGCTSFLPLERGLPESAFQTREGPTVRVWTVDGRSTDLHFASADPLSILGRPAREAGSEAISIPLADVIRVEEKRRDWKKTGIRAGVTIATLALTIHLASQNNKHFLGF